MADPYADDSWQSTAEDYQVARCVVKTIWAEQVEVNGGMSFEELEVVARGDLKLALLCCDGEVLASDPTTERADTIEAVMEYLIEVDAAPLELVSELGATHGHRAPARDDGSTVEVNLLEAEFGIDLAACARFHETMGAYDLDSFDMDGLASTCAVACAGHPWSRGKERKQPSQCQTPPPGG